MAGAMWSPALIISQDKPRIPRAAFISSKNAYSPNLRHGTAAKVLRTRWNADKLMSRENSQHLNSWLRSSQKFFGGNSVGKHQRLKEMWEALPRGKY